ncbi:hypothetical protein L5876_05875 [Hyphobacterium sp. SN044]|uniref:hypothetical protein n=1 Tax=Hyphobacterium sp. SN044 TaxID=2912575 RepID=UPI001F3C200F|nr:hypothetical protein [Hyphobacterium sp. SN044]MCF8879337.1 hypothetical protein [Hyphobacterium sp. SN044]
MQFMNQSASALAIRGAVIVIFGGIVLKTAMNGASAETWIVLIAPAFFVAAMWALSNVFGRIDDGVPFGAAMLRSLKWASGALLLGAFAAIILQPSLIYLMANGFTEMRGVRLDWSAANLMLASLGFALLLIARRGEALKARLEEFV